MAKTRRRSAANGTQEKSPPPSKSDGNSEAEPGPSKTDKEACPACDPNTSDTTTSERVSWIQCGRCRSWYHWECVGKGADVETVDKWYCDSCMDKDPSLHITSRAPVRKSVRKRIQRDYANLNSGRESDPHRWLRVIEQKTFKPDPFRRLKGKDVSLKWLEDDELAMTEPIVIEKPDGLGMEMPNSEFTVADVTELVGPNTPLEVIDVASQSTSPGWTLGKWNEYIEQDPHTRDKILNVISLEVSGTKLGDMIAPPQLVRDLDWVEKYWPPNKKGKGHTYPKVQLYCLMGVANAWTDWHIDFAGSSVYYHIIKGSKIFYFIRPTPENLAAYEKWSGTELQTHTWLGDMVDEVYKVELTQGNTMIIPTGWIHAVHTPVDTLVFGGNFLHSYNVATQLRVRNIEIATQVPKKFRFPMFSKLCWYTVERILNEMKTDPEWTAPPRLLDSFTALTDFLMSEVRTLEGGTEAGKKELKDQIPYDKVKDPPALAREFRWRLRHAAGAPSDDESVGPPPRKAVNGTKRKRTATPPTPVEEARQENGLFMHFRPRKWDKVVETHEEIDLRKEKVRRPVTDEDEDAWEDSWVDGSARIVDEDDEEAADVKTRKQVVVKLRRTDKGVERHRIERIIEVWNWT